MVPRAVLMKSGLVSINTARQNISKIAVLVNTARQVNTAHLKTIVNVARPMDKHFNTARPKAVVNVVKGNNLNDVKASTCCVWKPKHKVLDHANLQMDLQDKGVIDSGCLRHMTRNMSYLTDYEEIDGGYVSFGGNPKGGKIVRKGTIKTMNKLVKGNLVRGLPPKLFENDQTCVAFQKGKQHRASCKFDGKADEGFFVGYSLNSKAFRVFNSKTRIVEENLHIRFSESTPNVVGSGPDWLFDIDALTRTMNYEPIVAGTQSNGFAGTKASDNAGQARKETEPVDMSFFSSSKDETSGILKSFISGIENLVDHKVKVIRCDNGTEFKNREMNQFCEMKGILRQFSVARTPQQNGVAERRNRTLIDGLLGRASCKFDGKADEGFFVGYSLNSKAFRVFNSKTRIVEENLHIRFSESTPNVVGTKASDNAGQARKETEPVKDYILLLLWTADLPFSQDPKSSHDDGFKPSSDDGKKVDEDPRKDSECKDQEKEDNVNSTNNVNTVSSTVNRCRGVGEVLVEKQALNFHLIQIMPALEDDSIFDFSRDDEDDAAVADMNNLDTTIQSSSFPHSRIHKDILLIKVIRDLQIATQTKEDVKGIRSRRNMVYQIDVKSVFLNGNIEEEVYVCQPLGLEDSDFLDRVYKVEKALYGLHQAPKAWYETLSTYLLDNRFQSGEIDKTLFIKRNKGDILLVQVYVDDIIFGSTKKELCNAFEKLMHEKFQMSSMGELTFFLGLQVQQKKDGIFISQDKYVAKILKNLVLTESQDCSTPMETQSLFSKDEDGEEVDVHMYRSMIGSLMYLTSLRPDIMFAVCACTRYQVNPKVSHLYVVKRIFRYLKGQPKLGLWYPKDSPFDLVAYTDSDYARASLDRKSTTGGCQFLGCRLILKQCKKQTVVANSTTEAEYVPASRKAKKSVKLMMEKLFRMELELMLFWSTVKAKNINGEEQLHALVDGKKIIITESSVRRDLQLADEEGKGFSGRVTSLFPTMGVQNQSQIGEGSANPTDPHHTPTFIQPSPQPQKTQKPRKPKRKGTRVPQPSDPTRSVADEVVHKELGDSLVRAATTASSLEAEQDSGNITKTRSKATPNESSSLGTTSGGGPRCQETMGDTIAQTRVHDLKKTKTTQHNENASLKRRVKKLEKKNRSRTHKLKRSYKVSLTARIESSDDEESLGEDASKQGRIDAIDVDKEITLVSVHDMNVSAGEEVAEEVVEVINIAKLIINVAQVSAAGDKVSTASATTTISAATTTIDKGKGILIEPVKKKDQILLDEETALNLQAEFDDEERLAREKAKKKGYIISTTLKKRRRHFAAKRAEEKRNKPLTKVQQRKKIYTYLKNMEGYKLNDLKLKEFDSIQEMFNRAFKRVHTFEDFRTKLVKGKEKRARTELAQEITKKQKVEDDKETTRIKKLMEIIPDEEEVAIDAIPLAVKSPSIIDWMIHKEGRKSYEDLETLYKFVKAKYDSTRPVEDLDLLLLGDLKTMFEPHIEDKIYMLVEKKYPLTPSTLTMMLEKKLMID
ncbi:retrovirus-related pol polyprotein from transposon TNT 1-94 [Tanacetum coccineum]